jgi:hypothetical protein
VKLAIAEVEDVLGQPLLEDITDHVNRPRFFAALMWVAALG